MNDKPVAIVTGSARGIGNAIALKLASQGFNIAGVDLSLVSKGPFTGLEESRATIEDYGVEFLPVETDISNLEGQTAIIDTVTERFGRIDMLVNNAGVAPRARTDVLETPPDSFDRLISINLRGPFFLTQVVVNKMLESSAQSSGIPGRVVFITSISADVPSSSRADYCISKAGLSMAAKVFAERLADSGIGVFEVRPGIIQTEMTRVVKDKYDRLISEGLVPQKRWGMTEDVARVVASIARGDFDYSTGMVFHVTGGMNIRGF